MLCVQMCSARVRAVFWIFLDLVKIIRPAGRLTRSLYCVSVTVSVTLSTIHCTVLYCTVHSPLVEQTSSLLLVDD
jgi:hypothetical protein